MHADSVISEMFSVSLKLPKCRLRLNKKAEKGNVKNNLIYVVKIFVPIIYECIENGPKYAHLTA